MARRISLKEFQENLVRRLNEARSGDRRTLLGIMAGEDRWLIDLTDTGEVLPPTPVKRVPLTQPWFLGITNVRGTLYSVVDFAGLHGKASGPSDSRTRMLLVHQKHGVHSALLCSRTTGLHGPEEFELQATDQHALPWISALAIDSHGNTWNRLDVLKLIRHPDFLEAGASYR